MKEFMCHVVNADSSADGLNTFKKEFNIKHCIHFLAWLWESVTVNTVLKNVQPKLQLLSKFWDPENDDNFEGF